MQILRFGLHCAVQAPWTAAACRRCVLAEACLASSSKLVGSKLPEGKAGAETPALHRRCEIAPNPSPVPDKSAHPLPEGEGWDKKRGDVKSPLLNAEVGFGFFGGDHPVVPS
jgi:hypothetical protein